MTRKDTIIAAALVNAGLLVILFISALKNEEKMEKVAFQKSEVEPAALPPERVFASESKKIMAVDEVEEVLKQYAQKDSTSSLVSSQVAEPTLMQTPVEPVQEVKFTPKEEPVASYIEIKVKKGDVLEKIARQHHTTVSEIMKINNLTSTALKIGQTLKINSQPSEKKAIALPAKAPLEPTSAKYYTIKAGDNLWTIAVRNHIKVEELLKLNNMTEDKAKKLKPGDTIRTR